MRAASPVSGRARCGTANADASRWVAGSMRAVMPQAQGGRPRIIPPRRVNVTMRSAGPGIHTRTCIAKLRPTVIAHRRPQLRYARLVCECRAPRSIVAFTRRGGMIRGQPPCAWAWPRIDAGDPPGGRWRSCNAPRAPGLAMPQACRRPAAGVRTRTPMPPGGSLDRCER